MMPSEAYSEAKRRTHETWMVDFMFRQMLEHSDAFGLVLPSRAGSVLPFAQWPVKVQKGFGKASAAFVVCDHGGDPREVVYDFRQLCLPRREFAHPGYAPFIRYIGQCPDCGYIWIGEP